MTPVFAAWTQSDTLDSPDLARAVGDRAHFICGTWESMAEQVSASLKENDLAAVIGAGGHQGNHCTFAPENHPDSRSRARNRGRRFLNPFRAWQQTVLQVKRISGIHTLSSAAASGGSLRIRSHVCSGGVEGGIRRAACRIFSGSAFSYETCKRRKNEDGVREERTCGSARRMSGSLRCMMPHVR